MIPLILSETTAITTCNTINILAIRKWDSPLLNVDVHPVNYSFWRVKM